MLVLAFALALATPAFGLTPDYVSIRKDLFNRSCNVCHGVKPVVDRVPLEYEFLLKSPLELVVKGNPDESGLMLALTRKDKKKMPPPEAQVPKVTLEEIAVVKEWIKRGAPLNPPGEEDSVDADVDRPKGAPPEYYRALLQSLRPKAVFRAALPGGTSLPLSYELYFGKAKTPEPILIDITAGDGGFLRMFYDRVFNDDRSVLRLGQEELPITCVYLDGQDNRYGGKWSPLTPDFILRYYLVANDYSCSGPVNQDPAKGKLGETWDTYLFYEVRDPSTMLPIDAKLRYRWNDFRVVLEPHGRPQ